jgi:hypothetical protein
MIPDPDVVLAAAALALAALPALMFAANLRLYRPAPPPPADAPAPAVSVLIPARNEERCIAAAVQSARACTGVDAEILVLDDHSADATARIVSDLAAADPRVRLLSAPELPPGWCGKQHACWVLAQAARNPVLVFLDADVRLAPDGLARAVHFLRSSGADLVSGIPRQETGSLMEKLVLPLIHFVLLGFLPLWQMRSSRHPAYGSGCGQFFVADREAYFAVGGHSAIRTTLHDGIKLPRAFRAAGRMTDLFDATGAAACRMYRGARELWRGLSKNATEGLAAPAMIVPATLLLLTGQVLPFALLAAWELLSPPAAGLAVAAVAAAWGPRLWAWIAFRQSFTGAALHPLGILCLLAIQWYALTATLLGRPPAWKGRLYPAAAAGRHG